MAWGSLFASTATPTNPKFVNKSNNTPQLRQDFFYGACPIQAGWEEAVLRRGVHISVRNIFGGRPVPRCISAFRHMFVAAHHYCVLCVLGVPRMKNDEMACDARFGE